jgi:hypothetical protein
MSRRTPKIVIPCRIVPIQGHHFARRFWGNLLFPSDMKNVLTVPNRRGRVKIYSGSVTGYTFDVHGWDATENRWQVFDSYALFTQWPSTYVTGGIKAVPPVSPASVRGYLAHKNKDGLLMTFNRTRVWEIPDLYNETKTTRHFNALLMELLANG